MPLGTHVKFSFQVLKLLRPLQMYRKKSSVMCQLQGPSRRFLGKSVVLLPARLVRHMRVKQNGNSTRKTTVAPQLRKLTMNTDGRDTILMNKLVCLGPLGRVNTITTKSTQIHYCKNRLPYGMEYNSTNQTKSPPYRPV
jgi:hypothetical protein